MFETYYSIKMYAAVDAFKHWLWTAWSTDKTIKFYIGIVQVGGCPKCSSSLFCLSQNMNLNLNTLTHCAKRSPPLYLFPARMFHFVTVLPIDVWNANIHYLSVIILHDSVYWGVVAPGDPLGADSLPLRLHVFCLLLCLLLLPTTWTIRTRLVLQLAQLDWSHFSCCGLLLEQIPMLPPNWMKDCHEVLPHGIYCHISHLLKVQNGRKWVVPIKWILFWKYQIVLKKLSAHATSS